MKTTSEKDVVDVIVRFKALESKMGFYIRSLPSKKKEPRWKVQYVSYKKSDCQNPNAKKPKKEWDVLKERWRPLGFLSHMSIEEARCRAKQLNGSG